MVRNNGKLKGPEKPAKMYKGAKSGGSQTYIRGTLVIWGLRRKIAPPPKWVPRPETKSWLRPCFLVCIPESRLAFYEEGLNVLKKEGEKSRQYCRYFGCIRTDREIRNGINKKSKFCRPYLEQSDADTGSVNYNWHHSCQVTSFSTE